MRRLPAVVLLCALCCGCGNERAGPRSRAGIPAGSAAQAPCPKLSPEILRAAPDDKLVETVMGYVVYKTDTQQVSLTTMAPGLQMLDAVQVVDWEVLNGGLVQYFWNTSGKRAGAAVAGYNLLGADEHAKLMQEAIGIHEQQRPVIERYRQQNSLEAFMECCRNPAFKELDKRYASSQEDIRKLCVRYIREHPDQFVGD